jgi:curved DNA-binding protein CbpA
MASRSSSSSSSRSDADDEEDYYAVLGIIDAANVTQQQLRKAYHKLALIWHPDKAGSGNKAKAEQMFARINVAFGILSNPSSKATYDGVLQAQQLKKQREAEKSSKRKRMEQQLNERENEAKRRRMDDMMKAKQKLNVEKERLRKQAFEDMMKSFDDYDPAAHYTTAATNDSADDQATGERDTTRTATSSSSTLHQQRSTPIVDVPSVAELEKKEQKLFSRLLELQRQREAATT